MKFEPTKISKVINQNFSHLMPDFYEMQTEYLASLNIIYDDLDASLVGMVMTNMLYKNGTSEGNNKETISFDNFYQKDKYKLPVSSFKIKSISAILNLPRETVRRKKEKLIKDKIIILDKKKKIYTLNTEKIDKEILNVQINNLSRFLSKFSIYFSRTKFFVNELSRDQIRKDLDDKFLIYLTTFLDFQIKYFSNFKKILDIESIFIILLCALNTLSSSQSTKQKPINAKNLFSKLHNLNGSFGLNATSISEITKIPRTTVLRKIAKLEKIGMLRKDRFKRYASESLIESDHTGKLFPIVEKNISLLGIFFSECLETYLKK